MWVPAESDAWCAGEEPGVHVTVVCAGNELARDDGVGIRVGRVLQALSLPGWVEVRFYQELGWDVLDTMRGSSRVIVVDATWSGRAPGTCTIGELEVLAPSDKLPLGCHGFGLPLVAEMARRLGPQQTAARVTLVGIEAERLDGFCTQLSPPVRDALAEAVGLVLSELGAPSALIACGKELALEAASREPALAEAHTG